jgi:hypothetical protein
MRSKHVFVQKGYDTRIRYKDTIQGYDARDTVGYGRIRCLIIHMAAPQHAPAHLLHGEERRGEERRRRDAHES